MALKQLTRFIELTCYFASFHSALHIAAMFGRVEITDVLVNNGAIIGASEYRGYTALHLAAQYGHQTIIVRIILVPHSKHICLLNHSFILLCVGVPCT